MEPSAGFEPAQARGRNPALCPLSYEGEGGGQFRAPPHESVTEVIVPPAAVEAARPQAAFFESAVRSRTDTGRCARACRSAPCRRARRGRRAAPASPRHSPRLRLREVSKGQQVVELVASHGSLLWVRGRRSPPPPRLRRASCFVGRAGPAKRAARSRMVRAAGFEPATSWFQARSAAGLRYALKWTIQQDSNLRPPGPQPGAGWIRMSDDSVR